MDTTRNRAAVLAQTLRAVTRDLNGNLGNQAMPLAIARAVANAIDSADAVAAELEAVAEEPDVPTTEGR